MKLGVNLDHVATLRQARYRGRRLGQVHPRAEPDLPAALHAAESGGADGLTLHLREDRRHVQDEDVFLAKKEGKLPLNLEMSLSEEIVRIALRVRPHEVCLVPENRAEVTTEGGLDVVRAGKRLISVVPKLQGRGIEVSLFVAPDIAQIRAASHSGADLVELHTGAYAETRTPAARRAELMRLKKAAELAHALGLRVNAGHGLNYENIRPILALPHLETLNIGHTIVSRALFVGLEQAVCEMAHLVHTS